MKQDGSQFDVFLNSSKQGQVNWSLMGDNNISNALGAIAAARHVGVTPEIAIEALASFKSIKRRMEVKGKINNITVYDDFAHHPTAIKTTLAGLRAKVGNERIIAVLEPRSNTMKLGIHKEAIVDALNEADDVYCFEDCELNWSIKDMFEEQAREVDVSTDIDALCDKLVNVSKENDHILIMSNGGFAGIHQKLLNKL